MNRKLITTTICLTSLYFLLFYLSNIYKARSPANTETQAQEVIVRAICSEHDRPLTILQNTEIICESETGIYLRGQGKDNKLRDKEKEQIYHLSSLDLLISTTVSEVKIEKFLPPKDFVLLTTIQLPSNGRLVSTFSAKTQKGEEALFLSIELTVTSEKENKTKFYEVIFVKNGSDLQVSLKEFFTKEMLRVINYYSDNETLILREMHPFLQEKFRILELSNQSKLIPVPCTVERVLLDEKSPTFAVSSCLAYPQSEYLVFDQAKNTFSPIKIEAQVRYNALVTQSRELVAKYSTTIGKRVYNCFDFSESEQITLRSCIPEL